MAYTSNNTDLARFRHMARGPLCVVLGTCFLLVIALAAALGSILTRQKTSAPIHGGDLSADIHKPNSNLTTKLLPIRNHYQLPALTIARGNATTFVSASVGVRKEGSPIPALSTDIYHLGSLTKAMTATLLALLVQNNTTNLSWTSTLPQLLPGFTISPAHQNTTLQDLTSHRSGIVDSFNDSTFLSLYTLPAKHGRWLLANESLLHPPTQPRGSFTYANTNYILAGLILDLHSPSRSAETFFQSHLLHPLHMSTAGWGPCPEKSNTSIGNPWPHTPSPSGPIPLTGFPNWEKDNPPAFNTAGRMHMSPRDCNAFLQVHLSAVLGQRHNTLHLSPAQFTHLHTAYPSTNTSDPGNGYTYGGLIRRNFTVDVERISTLGKTPVPEYVLAHDGSNTLNFGYALLDSYAGEAYMALTNVGGSEADVGVQEVIVGMRNGTLIF